MTDVVLFVRSELLREGIEQVLREDHNYAVVTADSFDQVLKTAAACRPDTLIFELQDDPRAHWTTHLAALRRVLPMANLIGLSPTRRVDTSIEQQAVASHDRRFAVVSLRDSTSDLLNLLGISVSDSVHPAARAPKATSRPRNRVVLTRRELEVLKLLGTGLTTAQIGRTLGITAKTVENHKQHIYAKLGVQSQSHAVSVAVREGLIPTALATLRPASPPTPDSVVLAG